MVSPVKPAPVGTPAYSAVPNPEGSPTLGQSPDPNRNSVGYSDSQFLSPDADTHMLRPESGIYPAPSIISSRANRDSVVGTPNLDNRSSWGSNAAFAAAGAVGEGRPKPARGQSNLAYSSSGWNNTVDDRRDSEEDDGVGHVAPAAAGAGAGAATMSEKSPRWANNGEGKSRKKLWWILGSLLLLLGIGLAVGLGVGLTRGDRAVRNGGDSAAAGNEDNAGASRTSASASASSTSSAAPVPTSGGQGSTILLDDGTEMTYDNPFGGTWFYDPADPFRNDAQANSWTPPLSQNWTWGVDKINGVNVGGWLDTEPFIVPGLYERYANGSAGTSVDEFTLIQNMGDNATAIMTEHYDTFITERDFVEMVSNGINWVRLPIGHWAVATSPEEPYLERVSWEYVLKALRWARKYGIRINLDLHTMPGSQNGWNHSGHIGEINWLRGVMGLANAQRGLEIIRTLTQFIIQPEYAPVIPLWGFVNEPNANGVGQNAVGSFYYEVYRMAREITGTGEGNGPMLSMHDGFVGISSWYNFMPGADRMALDQHPYMCFGDQMVVQNNDLSTVSQRPCTDWAAATNQTSRQFGANTAGEWSAAVNDCGQWLNRVGAGARYEGAFPGYTGPTAGPGGCDYWNDHRLWTEDTKAELLNVVTRSMDALQNHFFWTWKIGNSTGDIPEPNPMWHYRLGLREGWVPRDPRSAVGACAAIGVSGQDFSGTFPSAWMTGGAGANEIPASASNQYPWPPTTFTNVAADQMTLLPQYTTTGSPITMPPATYTSGSSTISGGNGWANAQDTQSAFVPISGCSYPPEYSAQDMQPTQGACGAGLTQQAKRAPPAARTAAPAPRPRR